MCGCVGNPIVYFIFGLIAGALGWELILEIYKNIKNKKTMIYKIEIPACWLKRLLAHAENVENDRYHQERLSSSLPILLGFIDSATALLDEEEEEMGEEEVEKAILLTGDYNAFDDRDLRIECRRRKIDFKGMPTLRGDMVKKLFESDNVKDKKEEDELFENPMESSSSR